MDRRANVVQNTRQGQLGGPRTASDGWVGFADQNAPAGPRDRHSRGKAIGTRADDDGIVVISGGH